MKIQVQHDSGGVSTGLGMFRRREIRLPDGKLYMVRYYVGSYYFHVFYTGDLDAAPHDHPFEFWTFPLTPYIEEVWDEEPNPVTRLREARLNLVPALKWSYRPPTYTHRVMGRWAGGFKHVGHDIQPILEWDSRKMYSLVKVRRVERRWGFLKSDGLKQCWVHWKLYLSGNAANTPCD